MAAVSLGNTLNTQTTQTTQNPYSYLEQKQEKTSEFQRETSDEVTYSNEENEEEYCYGGYHPVQINEVFGPQKNYTIIRKLGWGHFSTVWLAYDSINKKHVALKIVKSHENYHLAALDEIKILKTIKETNPDHYGYNHVIKLLDHFTHTGPNGEHVVMVFEVLGDNLFGIIEQFKQINNASSDQCNGLPFPLIKVLTKQMCYAFDYLHRECGIIHTDIKPENILIELKDSENVISKLLQQQQPQIQERNKQDKRKNVSVYSSEPLPSLFLEVSRSNSRSKYFRIRAEKYLSAYAHRPKKDSPDSDSDVGSSSSGEYNNSDDSSQGSSFSVFSNDSNSQYSTDSYDESALSQDFVKESALSQDFVKDSASLDNDCMMIDAENEDDSAEFEDSVDIFSFTEKRWSEIVSVRIADFGNACYRDQHFSELIQTRQYRSPEVITGHEWDHTADSWSFACVLFELITGEYLFEPKAGKTFGKNDDHLAQILELLEPAEEQLIQFNKDSQLSSRYFKEDMKTPKKIKTLKYWTLEMVLYDKYNIDGQEVEQLADLLYPLLELDPARRVDISSCIGCKWLEDC